MIHRRPESKIIHKHQRGGGDLLAMLIDQEVTLNQLIFAVTLPKPSHILAEEHIHPLGIPGRSVRLLDADARFQGKGSGHLKDHLTDTRAEIDECVLLADGDVLEHLLDQLVAGLAIHLRREWLILVELVGIEYGSIVN